MLMLRATRTLKPARSISISVRLVSSSSSASSRISALSPDLSPGLDFAAVVSSGWRAMIVIRNFLFDAVAGQAFALVPISLAPILAARPLIASRYPSMPKPHRLANAALAVKE